MAVSYRSAALPSPEAGGVVVIHCSDPRYQPHFQDFLRSGLKLDHYALIAVPGGAQFLTLADYLPKFSWVGWRWAKFLTDLTRPDRLVLIAHDDCRWYLDGRFWGSPDLHARQVADLRRAGAQWQERFGNGRVDLFYARHEKDGVSFESL